MKTAECVIRLRKFANQSSPIIFIRGLKELMYNPNDHSNSKKFCFEFHTENSGKILIFCEIIGPFHYFPLKKEELNFHCLVMCSISRKPALFILYWTIEERSTVTRVIIRCVRSLQIILLTCWYTTDLQSSGHILLSFDLMRTNVKEWKIIVFENSFVFITIV